MPSVRGLTRLREQLPAVSLKASVASASKAYEDPAQVALRQTRSQMCAVSDPGYAPPDFSTARQLLTTHHKGVIASLQIIGTCAPELMGTNMDATELSATVRKMGTVSSEAKRVMAHADLTSANVQQVFDQAHQPEICIVQQMPGLRTYPFVASASGVQPLRKGDRAALLVSNEVMVGGMGSVFTHELRQRGVSYRPAGGVQLGWQSRPVFLLHATFDASQASEGRQLTTDSLSLWCRGDASVFTDDAVEKAKTRVVEKLLLTRMDYDTQKYSMWADLDPRKYSGREIRRAIDMVTSKQIVDTLPSYFTSTPVINQSWVRAIGTPAHEPLS